LHFTQYPVATGSPPRAILNATRSAVRTPSEAAGIVPPPYSTPETTKPRHRGGASW
jgi:hypothetical protein